MKTTPSIPQTDYPSADSVLPSEQASAATWLNLLLGRFILRACPSGSKVAKCPGCQLQPLCCCAHTHLRSAALLESRFWLIAVLTVGVCLYCVLAATQHSGAN